MGALSKSLLVAFEIVNELYTAVGAGIVGMVILLKHGFESRETLKSFSVVMITAASLLAAFSVQRPNKLEPSNKRVIFITGCDSGLGFSLAQHAADCGFTVIAGFLNLNSKGSKEIRRLYEGFIIQVQLDITDSNSIRSAVQSIEHFLKKNPEYMFHALVNNAGVMVFAEFEWLTEKLIHQQISVNLLGTFNTTKAFCPLLRQHRGRLITVSSHCALANLPGLAVYGASKAALSSWSDGLRVELGKYGVSVLTFIPGSFTTHSNIMANQLHHVQEMHDNFTEEQHRFYSDYFKRYNIYLSFIKPPPLPVKIVDDKLYQVFDDTLLDEQPKTVYKHEPLRYAFYYFLFKYSPVFLRDYFVTKFIQMPEYTQHVEDTVDDEEFDLEINNIDLSK